MNSYRIVHIVLGLLLIALSTNSPKHIAKLQADSETVIPVPLFGGSGDALALGSFPQKTGTQIVNLDSATATVEVVRYNADGTEHSTVEYSVDANDSLTIFPLENPVGRPGAIEIKSEQDITAIFNLVRDDFSMGGSYIAAQPSTQILLPLLSKSNFSTMFGLQNINDVAATVSISYSDGTSREETISAHSTMYIFQSLETHNAPNFAGMITSNVPLSAAIAQSDTNVSFVYSGFVSSSTSPAFPLVNVGGGSSYMTGIQIQNSGSESTEVTLAYTPSVVGTACTETQTIAPGDSVTLALFAFSAGSNSDCSAGSQFVGAASVTENSTNQPLVGVSNQLLSGVNGEAYGSFIVADATDTVVLPLIMDRNSGFFTGFNVANVGISETNVICTFTNSDYIVSGSIPVGGALTDIQSGKIGDGYVGAATCRGDTDAKIVAVVNQLGSNGAADQFFVYEGINR